MNYYGSLTDKQNYSNQLRFSTKARIERYISYNLLAIKNRFKEPIDLYIYHKGQIDVGSNIFLEIYRKYEIGNIYFENLVQEEYYKDYLEKVVKDALNENKYEAYDIALKFLSVGDGWTAINIIKNLIDEKNENDCYYYDLGIAYTQIGETERAEYYLTKSKESLSEDRQIDSNYALAMLYARHHPIFLKSDKLAEKLLNEAYSCFSDSEINFYKIFNRNGFALLLYKRNEIEKAIQLLKVAIKEISTNKLSKLDNSFHESVLTYNLIQCYMKINSIEDVKLGFEKLLKMDPLFLENHLEYANFLIKIKDYKNAFNHLQIALNFNPYVPEIHSLLGIYYLNLNYLPESKEHFHQSYIYSGKEVDFLYDYCFVLNELEEYNKTTELVNENVLNEVASDEEVYIDLVILLVEAYLNTDHITKAIDIFEKGCNKYPHNDLLKQNKDNLISVKRESK
ncbi:tetratricopeptide repeat protein [Staphylococcus sp. MI 10-1553]|uniref:tetratricopeptide repeat protein n=1 Tax=Staphylococcus sp. MI 10-1553 TaxID=1912064 RepID=UPI001EF145C2|nr:hypothetical protein [Staphylococcus sp. MI 10-1553]